LNKAKFSNFLILLSNRVSWSATSSKSKFYNSLWSTFSAPDRNRLLTFHVPFFTFLFQIRSSSVIPSFRGSFEKFAYVYFYLAGGLGCHKTLNLKGQDFWSGFTPLYDLLSPKLPEHRLLLVWFWIVLLGGLQPSSRVPHTLCGRPLWSGPSDPLALSAQWPMLPKGLDTWTLALVTHLNRTHC